MTLIIIIPQELGEKYLAKLFSNERTLYDTFFAEQKRYNQAKRTQVIEEHSKDLDNLKGLQSIIICLISFVTSYFLQS